MSKPFWGFFFIFINFNLNVNQYSLNILPPFVGYILLWQGMRQLEGESSVFRGPQPFAVGMAIYTGILWLGNLLGMGSSGSWVGALLDLVAMAVSLYVSWAVVQGVQDLEERRETDLNGASMQLAWRVMAVAKVVSYVLALFHSLLSLVGVIAALIGVILLLVAFWRGKKLYEQLPPLWGSTEA